MCKKLFLLICFLLVLDLVGSTSAALPQGWQSRDIGTTGGSAAEDYGTWIISADGADVWGNSDEFHYAYVPLSGNGEIVARVVDNGTGSNGWAKGGVMIRETLDADSKHAIMALTGGEGGGLAFQNRQETGGSSFSSHGNPTAEPLYWVKLTRVGNTITGYSSPDGVTWERQPDSTGGDMTTNPVEIEMAADVYIGIFVTSHASGEVRTYTFDNVVIELLAGDVETGGVKAEYFRGMSLRGEPYVWIEDAIDHQWGNGEIAFDLFDQVSARWTADLKITVPDWYTFVTNSDDGVRLWLDGERIINNWTDHGPTLDTSAPMYLEPGLYSLQMEWYENSGGAVAQLFWQTPDRERAIIQAGPLQLPVSAGSPYPHDGAFNVSQSLTLSWTAGYEVMEHLVYFGENFNAVNTGTGGTFRGTQDSTFFVVGSAGFPYPNGLGPGTTYFWRVDEVQADGTTRKGKVWRFTTAVFSVDDNFDSFTDEPGNRIFDTWIDGSDDPLNGATVPYADQTNVFSGKQSMLFEYNNTGNVDYSEATRTFTPTQNWDDRYVDALILFVYGRTDNVADTLYIKIEDDAGRAARVEHPDHDVLRSEEWTPWRIPLIEFELANASINLNRIRTMSIGVGRPGPSQPPPPDELLNDDCVNAIHIGNVTNLPFDTTNATFDGPGHYNTGDNVWYRYTAPRTCDVTIDLCDSSYDTKLVVYDGWDCYPSYGDIVARANDNCGQYGLRSKVTFAAIAGHRYLIEIGGDTGSDWGPGLMTIGCEDDLNSPLLRDGPKLFANSDSEEEGEEGEFNVDEVITAGHGFKTLTGIVRKKNNDKKPISGATVTLMPDGFKNLLPTGSNGKYAVILVDEGTHYNAYVTAPNSYGPFSVDFDDNWIITKHFELELP